jgi:hypothetical protein
MHIEVSLQVRCFLCGDVFRVSPAKPFQALCQACGADPKETLRRVLKYRRQDTTEHPSEYLSIDDACRELGGISRETLRRYRKDGRLATYMVSGRPMFKRKDILNLPKRSG